MTLPSSLLESNVTLPVSLPMHSTDNLDLPPNAVGAADRQALVILFERKSLTSTYRQFLVLPHSSRVPQPCVSPWDLASSK